MRRTWSPAAEDKLRALYATTPLPRLAFLLKRTEKAIRSRAKVLGIRKTDRRPWTRKEDALLRRRYATEQTADLALELGRTPGSTFQRANALGLSKATKTIAECTARRWREGRHENSRKAQFQPGQVSWNKGTKGVAGIHPNCRKTQFRKGELTGAARHNYVPVGTEKVRDGYLCRKVTDDPALYPAARWQPVHRLVWEATNGPVPAGHAVAFKAGRATTELAAITVDALELISRAELCLRNSRHTRYPPEVNQLIQLKGALNRKLNRRLKEAA